MTDAMNLSTLAFPPTTEHRLFTPSRPGPAIGDTPEAEVPTATPPAPFTQVRGEEPGAEGPGRNSSVEEIFIHRTRTHERDRDRDRILCTNIN